MTERTESRAWQRAATWARSRLKPERIGRFLLYTVRRFVADGGPRQAAGLGYISLLSIVPMLAIALGVLAAFPAFGDVRQDIQTLIFDNFLPSSSAAVSEQLLSFIDNAGQSTAVGVIVFGVTAVLLLNNINGALNEIWRVQEPRPLALRFLVYWALLSLGPLLLGASLAVGGVVFTKIQVFGVDTIPFATLLLSRLVSVTLSALGFTLIFYVVPGRAVLLQHAFAGGLVAAVLFELLKFGFGIYIANFGSYEAIYGALSAVPIFLLWMYLSWVMILFGAEFAAALPEWRAAQARGRHVAGPGQHLALALGLLSRLRTASRSGRGALRERILVQGLPATPAEVDASLRDLRKAKVVDRSLGSRWLLARDLSTLTLGELARDLNLDLEPGEGWPPAAEKAVAGLVDASGDHLALSLETLLGALEREALTLPEAVPSPSAGKDGVAA